MLTELPSQPSGKIKGTIEINRKPPVMTMIMKGKDKKLRGHVTESRKW